MHAAVTVTGNRVVVELDNLTSHHSFRKVLHTPSIDVSSAEWIVEAPSECLTQFSCQALPLANFGAISFDAANVVAANGAAGSIAGGDWARTRITLTPGAQRLIVSRNSTGTAGAAAPSALRGGGSTFDVTFATASDGSSGAPARESRVRAAYIEH
jgi:hypothetical protein